jgi:hypothetical protein
MRQQGHEFNGGAPPPWSLKVAAFVGACCLKQIAEPAGRRLHIIDRFAIGTGQVACDVEAQFHLLHVTELSEGLGSTEHPVERFGATGTVKSGLIGIVCPLPCHVGCPRLAGDAVVCVADIDQ